jgi:hypothetical protein
MYLKMSLLLFLHKIIHVRHPSYIFSMFHFSSSQRSRDLRLKFPHTKMSQPIMYGDNIFLRNSEMVFEWLQHQQFAAT